jgi:LPXTG-motif cell wall-anchored protein
VLGDPPQANASPVQALSPAGIAAVEAPLRQQLPSTGGGGSSQMLVLAAAGAVLLGGALLGATRRR